MHSLWFVQWDFTRWDHSGNPGRVSRSGPVMLPTLVSQAPVSLVERKERSGPTVEAQDEEQHLARDPFDHQQPQEVVDLQDHLFHCVLHVRGGIFESVG